MYKTNTSLSKFVLVIKKKECGGISVMRNMQEDSRLWKMIEVLQVMLGEVENNCYPKKLKNRSKIMTKCKHGKKFLLTQ